MSVGNWDNIGCHLQGDISYDFKKVLVDPVYVKFELVAFGEKWKNFDIAFEYRLNETQRWREDALIVETSASYLKDNKMYGLNASKYGSTNIIKWKYSTNNLLYGSVPQIRIRFLPRLRIFGSSGQYHSIVSLYGDSLIDFEGLSQHNCVGINNDGNYICLGSHSIYIIDSLDVEKGSSSSESSSNSSASSNSSSSSSSFAYSQSSGSSSSSSSSTQKKTSSSSSSSSRGVYVSGSLTPLASGNYYRTTDAFSQPHFLRNDNAYDIWWHVPTSSYYITAGGVGNALQTGWKRSITGPNYFGIYNPINGAVGVATVG